MERVALDLRARDRRVEEIQVEERVVTHQHRARAFGEAHGVSDLLEDALQGVLLGNRGPQRVMRIDAVDGERSGLEIRPGERRHVIAVRLAARERAVAAHLDEHGRNLQQRVGLRN